MATAFPRVMVALTVMVMLLSQAPFASAAPCLNVIEGKANSVQIIFDVWTDALVVGAKASEPGEGKTLILIVHPNSCASSGLGPGLVERMSLASAGTDSVPSAVVLPLP